MFSLARASLRVTSSRYFYVVGIRRTKGSAMQRRGVGRAGIGGHAVSSSDRAELVGPRRVGWYRAAMADWGGERIWRAANV